MNMEQTIYDMLYPKYKINKPIRLIEMFSGYGSQALALKYLNIDFEHWKTCEWAVKSIQAYKDIHMTNDNNDYSKDLTEKEIKEYLFNKGISSNYNKSMTKTQVNRLSEKQVRTIYNNIIATHNLVNIQQVKGEDLEIVDTNKYDYILCYSFPCQDLSLAGKRALMSDTSTRSGMLWEVERILTECKELGTLPQILLMENVPQVHGEGAVKDFNKWQLRLEELGYKNYWQDLIATDYGIPQTRNRCFMISILGDYSYTFPEPIPLKLKLKDLLEDNVDGKYFLSDKQIKDIQNWNAYEKPLENMKKTNKSNISPTLTTRSGAYAAGMILVEDKYYLSDKMKKYIISKDDKYNVNENKLIINREIACSKTTREGNTRADTSDYICKELPENANISKIDVIGTYQFCKSDNFMKGRDRLQLGKELSDTIQTTPKETIVIKPQVLGGIGEKKSNNNTQYYQQDRIYDNNVAISVTTECNPYYYNNLHIRKLTPYECFALMGVKDEDFENCAKNQSDSSLYHLAGDSIVTNCLCAIFKQLL